MSEVALQSPCLLVFMSSCLFILFPLNVDWIKCLTSSKQNMVGVMGCHFCDCIAVTSILLAFYMVLHMCLLWWSTLGRSMAAGNEGQSMANLQQDEEAQRLTGAVTTGGIGLELDSSPGKTWSETTASEKSLIKFHQKTHKWEAEKLYWMCVVFSHGVLV